MKNTEEKKKLWTRLFNSTEGRIFSTGLVISVLYLAVVGLSFLWSPEKAQIIMGMTAMHILFGRAAGMSFGYTLSLGHSIVIPVNMIIETVMVFLFYPLFVFSWQRLIIVESLKNIMERSTKAAEANQGFIKKYGMIGLLAFVWFPFWMTGPLVGCIIGFLMGLPARKNLIIVMSGTYLAIFCWAFLLRELHERIAAFSPYAPLILLMIVILLMIAGFFLQGGQKKKK